MINNDYSVRTVLERKSIFNTNFNVTINDIGTLFTVDLYETINSQVVRCNLSNISKIMVVLSDSQNIQTKKYCNITDETNGKVSFSINKDDIRNVGLVTCEIVALVLDSNNNVTFRATFNQFTFNAVKSVDLDTSYLPDIPVLIPSISVLKSGWLQNYQDNNNNPPFLAVDNITNNYNTIIVGYANVKNDFTVEYDDTKISRNDIIKLKSTGKKVLLSLGGNNKFTLSVNTSDGITNMITSFKKLISDYQFDGFDISLINVLQASPTSKLGQTQTDSTTECFIQAFENLYSDSSMANKMLTISCGISDVFMSRKTITGETPSYNMKYNGYFGGYLSLIHRLRNYITVVQPRMYNLTTDIIQSENTAILGNDGNNHYYIKPYSDFYISCLKLLRDGFTVTTIDDNFIGMGSKIGISTLATATSGSDGYNNSNEISKILSDIKNEGIVLKSFNQWNLNWSNTDNNSIIKTVNSVLGATSNMGSISIVDSKNNVVIEQATSIDISNGLELTNENNKAVIKIAKSGVTSGTYNFPANVIIGEDGRISNIDNMDFAYTFYEKYTATANQTVFSLIHSYNVGQDKLKVFVNGEKKTLLNYTETNNKTVTFNNGLSLNDVVEFFVDTGIVTNKDYIELSFTNTEAKPDGIIIGLIQAGMVINRVDLVIQEPFDNTISISIGDDLVKDRFIKSASNDPTTTDVYSNNVATKYLSDTNVKVYCNGTSTKGKATVYVYWS